MRDGTVIHDVDGSRYEYVEEGHVLAIADYRLVGEQIVMHHTETRASHRGRGIGEMLVAGALDDVRARELHVVPECWFVAEFIDRHPEYHDLLAS
jgi:predicted GNAT family acetyltransferase